LTINSSMINGNLAENQGGGLYCDSSSAQIINSTVIGNIADGYGGGIYYFNSTAAVTNCTFSANAAEWYGGAIRGHNDSNLTITNSIFWDNRIENEEGAGPEIALSGASTATISHSNIQSSQNSVSREFDCTLNWDETNIDADPYFVQEGYWDTNNTSEDTGDDFWVDGDYQLLVSSPCIEKGDNDYMVDNDYDIAGNDRIVNSIIDMGAYESGGLQISKFTVKAGKIDADRIRRSQSDSFSIKGTIDATENDFDNSEICVRLTLFERVYEETIDTNSDLFKKNSSNTIYKYKRSLKKDENGAITYMKFDLLKGTFYIKAKKIDLSGLQDPVPVEIEIGDYYRSAIVGEDIINRRKPVPMRFMFGRADSIRIDKYRFKPAKNPGTASDFLLVTGAIAVEDVETNLLGQEVTVRLGTFEATIPPGNEGLLQKGTKYYYKKPKNLDDPLTNYVDIAIINLVKCTFKILIKSADIGSQPDSADFSIAFASLDVSDTIP